MYKRQPYALILKGRELPSIFELPDLSELKANKEYGMGDKEHNIKLTKEREEMRKVRNPEEVNVWIPDETIDNSDNPNGIEFEETEDYPTYV